MIGHFRTRSSTRRTCPSNWTIMFQAKLQTTLNVNHFANFFSRNTKRPNDHSLFRWNGQLFEYHFELIKFGVFFTISIHLCFITLWINSSNRWIESIISLKYELKWKNNIRSQRVAQAQNNKPLRIQRETHVFIIIDCCQKPSKFFNYPGNFAILIARCEPSVILHFDFVFSLIY